MTVRDLVGAQGLSLSLGLLSDVEVGRLRGPGRGGGVCAGFPALHTIPLIYSLSHFEADQAHRVRSWLPGSYQLDRLWALASALQVFGEGLLPPPDDGVECSEH